MLIEINLSKLERGLREGRVKVTRGGKTFWRKQRVGVKEGKEKPEKELEIIGLNKPEVESGEINQEKYLDRLQEKLKVYEAELPNFLKTKKTIKRYGFVRYNTLSSYLRDPEHYEREKFRQRKISEDRNIASGTPKFLWSVVSEDEMKKEMENLKEEIGLISEYLSGAPKYEGIVYRGMKWELEFGGGADYEDFLQHMKGGVGNIVQFKSFTSTSVDKNIIDKFLEKGDPKIANVIFEIRAKGNNGVFLGKTANLPSEKEVMFDKDTKFKILSSEDYEDERSEKTTKIIMEEV